MRTNMDYSDLNNLINMESSKFLIEKSPKDKNLYDIFTLDNQL